jgi:hypothetical protein
MKLEGKSLWTLTGYTLWKLLQAQQLRKEVGFGELKRIFFDVLFRGQKVIWVDGPADLFADLLYLEVLGAVEISGKTKELDKRKIKIRDEKKLSEIAEVVKKSPQATGIELLGEYTRRVDEGIKSLTQK